MNDPKSRDTDTVETRIPDDNEVESALLIMRRADIAFERAPLSARRPGEYPGGTYACNPGWRVEWPDRG